MESRVNTRFRKIKTQMTLMTPIVRTNWRSKALYSSSDGGWAGLWPPRSNAPAMAMTAM